MRKKFIWCLMPWLLAPAVGQVIDDTVAGLLQLTPPKPPGVSANPAAAPPALPFAPLSPAQAPGTIITNILPNGMTNYILRPPGRRPMRPRKPSFEFREKDRVLFLGDSLLRGEAGLGYLETRLVSQYPQVEVTFRHLSWLTNHPLATPRPAAADSAAPETWLKPLLAQAALVKPTVVVLAYGTEASQQGEAGLPAFKADYSRLVDGLKALDTNVTLRFILFSPLCYETLPTLTTNAANANDRLTLYASAVRDLATQHEAEFVDVHGWIKSDIQAARSRAAKTNLTYQPVTDDGLHPNAFGYARLGLLLEASLRWVPNVWRFGLMPNDTLRDGGFGLSLLEHHRTDQQARVVVVVERLPNPIVPGHLDLQPGAKPQCYIQITQLKPGHYALKIDGRQTLVGSEADWARYEIIGEGPQWDQAEALRQTIVQKNALVEKRFASPPSAATAAALDAQIAEMEAKIATLRKPVKHILEVVPVPNPNSGDAPPKTR